MSSGRLPEGTPSGSCEKSLANDPDLLGTASLFTEAEQDWRTRTRAFVDGAVRPHIEEWWEQGILPRSLYTELGSSQLLGMNLNENLSPTAYGLACMELEAGDSGVRTFASVQSSLVMYALASLGSDALVAEWIPQLARGEKIGCFGLTEPDSGSDPSAMSTYARREGKDWILDGRKAWITSAGIADLAIIWAHTEEGVRGYAVPTTLDGVETGDMPNKMSLRASNTGWIKLDRVRVPEEMRLTLAESMRGPLACLGEARFGVAWGVLGAAEECQSLALGYAKRRHQFGRSIAGFQLTQDKLVSSRLAIDKGLLLAWHMARQKEAGRLSPSLVSAAKLNNTRTAAKVTRLTRSIIGAEGITSKYSIMRHMANLEAVATYEGTSEIHTLILGRTMTQESAFT